MDTLTDLAKAQAEMEWQLVEEAEAWGHRKKVLESGIMVIQQQREMLANGVDIQRIARGEALLVLKGKPYRKSSDSGVITPNSERIILIEGAIRALSNGGEYLRKQYMGTKNYAHWSDQRSDHPYGYGPKHGSIVFEVGLACEVRDRALTAEEAEDAIYLLEQLKRNKYAPLQVV